MPIISGPVGMDPALGEMRTIDTGGGSASGDYTFNTAEFTVGIAGLVSLNRVPGSKLDTVMDVVNVSGSSVTLEPNTAYKIYATSQAITLNANSPAAGEWAYDGHLELFVAGTGYVVTGPNVVLANALEPDAVNNCTVRFHDGLAIIAVEDHVAGYIVVNGSTSGDGSLYYGISTSTNNYVVFDASLNGTTIPLAGAVAEVEKHVVGNGYTETTLTGAVDCGTSKFTVANLSLNNVQVTGGVMTLGDAFIPSGSTVGVSGGTLTVEKVTGAGSESVIDLGETDIRVSENQSSYVDNVTITSGYYRNGGAVLVNSGGIASAANTVFSDCKAESSGGCIYIASASVIHLNGAVIQNCSAYRGGAVFVRGANTKVLMSGCTVRENSAGLGGGIYFIEAGPTVYLNDSVVSGNTNGDIWIGGGDLYLEGSNRIGQCSGSSGIVTLASGAILDLTGNTNSAPIAPGGGIVFESGGATVQLGSTAGSVESSYMMDNVTLPAGAKLMNTAVVNLAGSNCYTIRNFIASGATFTSGYAVSSASVSNIYGGGAFFFNGGNSVLSDCIISGNSGQARAGGVLIGGSASVYIGDCVVSGNTVLDTANDLLVRNGVSCTISGSTVGEAVLVTNGVITFVGNNTLDRIRGSGYVNVSSGASIALTSSIETTNAGGITVLTGGCTVNGNDIPAGTYTRIDSNGQPT